MRTNMHVNRTAMIHAAMGLGMLAVAMLAMPAAAAQAKAKAKAGSKVDIVLIQPMHPTTGDNAIEVMVKGADGKPIADADVSVLFVMPAMPAMKMPEMRNEVKLKPAGNGKYAGSGTVGMAGTWNTTVKVKKDGKELGHKNVTLTAK